MRCECTFHFKPAIIPALSNRPKVTARERSPPPPPLPSATCRHRSPAVRARELGPKPFRRDGRVGDFVSKSVGRGAKIVFAQGFSSTLSKIQSKSHYTYLLCVELSVMCECVAQVSFFPCCLFCSAAT